MLKRRFVRLAFEPRTSPSIGDAGSSRTRSPFESALGCAPWRHSMHTNRLIREASDGVAELWRAISRVLPDLHSGQTAPPPPPASVSAGEEPSSSWSEFMRFW
jgi:hypothetical protein